MRTIYGNNMAVTILVLLELLALITFYTLPIMPAVCDGLTEGRLAYTACSLSFPFFISYLIHELL